MNNVIVSIIMPVYNSEKYLERAIDSIIGQIFVDWILIAVDDGSSDSSGERLDSYSLSEPRIRVFHQENKGISAARQFGIDRAEGKYCIQVDSDDWLEPDYLNSLVNCAESNEADLVWCDCFRNEEDIWKQDSPEDPIKMIGAILDDRCWGTLWNKLIKTEICHLSEVCFPTNCRMWEDKAFIISALANCKKVRHCDKPLYHYNTENNFSLLHRQFFEDMQDDVQSSINQIDKVLTLHGINCFSKELTRLKLLVVKDYVDDLRRLDYDKYLNTYPGVLDHISEYPEIPNRHIFVYWVLRHNLKCLVPVIMKLDSLHRKIFS